jgi:hypothetical protein
MIMVGFKMLDLMIRGTSLIMVNEELLEKILLNLEIF